MKNSNTAAHLSGHAALEARFAYRLAARLSEHAESLDADVSERLRFAREKAMERARAVRVETAQPVVGISATGAATSTCAGASSNSFTANQTGAISFTGLTIPAGGSCTVSVIVKSNTAGMLPNTASGVSSNEAATGAVSNTATLTVTASAPTMIRRLVRRDSENSDPESAETKVPFVSCTSRLYISPRAETGSAHLQRHGRQCTRQPIQDCDPSHTMHGTAH